MIPPNRRTGESGGPLGVALAGALPVLMTTGVARGAVWFGSAPSPEVRGVVAVFALVAGVAAVAGRAGVVGLVVTGAGEGRFARGEGAGAGTAGGRASWR